MAIEIVLKSSVAAAETELAVLVARLLGFDHPGNDLESSISAQVQTLIGNARIENRAGNYSLVQKLSSRQEAHRSWDLLQWNRARFMRLHDPVFLAYCTPKAVETIPLRRTLGWRFVTARIVF